MPTPIIPVLMSDISRLTKPVDILKHILQHYTHAPKNINDSFAEQEISLVYDLAHSGHDTTAIEALTTRSINSVLGRYFESYSSDVTVTLRDSNDGYYDLTFDLIAIVDGASHSISENFKVDRDGNLIYDFEG